MSDVNQDELINILNEKWGARPCPMCGEGQWIVSNKVFELREYNEGNLIIGGGTINPVVPITCGNCGNIIMVNPVAIGLLKKYGELSWFNFLQKQIIRLMKRKK